jgi:hypothetical protein
MTLQGNEPPVVIHHEVKFDTDIHRKLVEVQYDNDLKLTLIPRVDDAGNVIDLESFKLVHLEEVTEVIDGKLQKTVHDEAFAYYVNDGSSKEPKLLKVAKNYLGELLEIALQDYLFWELQHHQGDPEVVYAYDAAAATRDLTFYYRLPAPA